MSSTCLNHNMPSFLGNCLTTPSQTPPIGPRRSSIAFHYRYEYARNERTYFHDRKVTPDSYTGNHFLNRSSHNEIRRNRGDQRRNFTDYRSRPESRRNSYYPPRCHSWKHETSLDIAQKQLDQVRKQLQLARRETTVQEHTSHQDRENKKREIRWQRQQKLNRNPHEQEIERKRGSREDENPSIVLEKKAGQEENRNHQIEGEIRIRTSNEEIESFQEQEIHNLLSPQSVEIFDTVKDRPENQQLERGDRQEKIKDSDIIELDNQNSNTNSVNSKLERLERESIELCEELEKDKNGLSPQRLIPFQTEGTSEATSPSLRLGSPLSFKKVSWTQSKPQSEFTKIFQTEDIQRIISNQIRLRPPRDSESNRTAYERISYPYTPTSSISNNNYFHTEEDTTLLSSQASHYSPVFSEPVSNVTLASPSSLAFDPLGNFATPVTRKFSPNRCPLDKRSDREMIDSQVPLEEQVEPYLDIHSVAIAHRLPPTPSTSSVSDKRESNESYQERNDFSSQNPQGSLDLDETHPTESITKYSQVQENSLASLISYPSPFSVYPITSNTYQYSTPYRPRQLPFPLDCQVISPKSLYASAVEETNSCYTSGNQHSYPSLPSNACSCCCCSGCCSYPSHTKESEAENQASCETSLYERSNDVSLHHTQRMDEVGQTEQLCTPTFLGQASHMFDMFKVLTKTEDLVSLGPHLHLIQEALKVCDFDFLLLYQVFNLFYYHSRLTFAAMESEYMFSAFRILEPIMRPTGPLSSQSVYFLCNFPLSEKELHYVHFSPSLQHRLKAVVEFLQRLCENWHKTEDLTKPVDPTAKVQEISVAFGTNDHMLLHMLLQRYYQHGCHIFPYRHPGSSHLEELRPACDAFSALNMGIPVNSYQGASRYGSPFYTSHFSIHQPQKNGDRSQKDNFGSAWSITGSDDLKGGPSSTIKTDHTKTEIEARFRRKLVESIEVLDLLNQSEKCLGKGDCSSVYSEKVQYDAIRIVESERLKGKGHQHVQFKLPYDVFEKLYYFQNHCERCLTENQIHRGPLQIRLRVWRDDQKGSRCVDLQSPRVKTTNLLPSIRWPSVKVMRINGKTIVLQEQSDQLHTSLDISHLAIHGENTVCLEYQDGKLDDLYCMGVDLIRFGGVEDTLQIVRDRPKIARQTTLDHIKSEVEAEDSLTMVGFLNVDARDAVTYGPISTPVRTRSCRHVACFDLENWIQSRVEVCHAKERVEDECILERWSYTLKRSDLQDVHLDGKELWTCPVLGCGADAHPANLAIDEYFEEVVPQWHERNLYNSRRGRLGSISVWVNESGRWISPLADCERDELSVGSASISERVVEGGVEIQENDEREDVKECVKMEVDDTDIVMVSCSKESITMETIPEPVSLPVVGGGNESDVMDLDPDEAEFEPEPETEPALAPQPMMREKVKRRRLISKQEKLALAELESQPEPEPQPEPQPLVRKKMKRRRLISKQEKLDMGEPGSESDSEHEREQEHEREPKPQVLVRTKVRRRLISKQEILDMEKKARAEQRRQRAERKEKREEKRRRIQRRMERELVRERRRALRKEIRKDEAGSDVRRAKQTKGIPSEKSQGKQDKQSQTEKRQQSQQGRADVRACRRQGGESLSTDTREQRVGEATLEGHSHGAETTHDEEFCELFVGPDEYDALVGGYPGRDPVWDCFPREAMDGLAEP